MLPILRIISVGGVSLAIAILILALIPPGGGHLVVARQETAARGPLIDPAQHPEWRQFLIQSALRRAGELERLRSLSDTIAPLPNNGIPTEQKPAAQPEPDVAGLPIIVREPAPGDVTGSIDENPGATIPIDIGETSSTELPVMPVEETPPTSRIPALQTPVGPQSALAPAIETSGKAKRPEPVRRVVQQRARRKPATPQPATPNPAQVPPPFNILVAILGGLSANTPAAQAQQKAAPGPSATSRIPPTSGSRVVTQ